MEWCHAAEVVEIKDRSIDIKAFINRVYVNSTRVCIITPKSKSSDIDRLPT